MQGVFNRGLLQQACLTVNLSGDVFSRLPDPYRISHGTRNNLSGQFRFIRGITVYRLPNLEPTMCGF
jgi:hypothetical protein